MHREERPPTFVDALMPEELGRNKRLDRIDEMLDWDPVARLVSAIHSSTRGAPSYRPLVMVKVLLLEQWYTLSDPEMEEALGDRLSFRRFVGLGVDDGTPDHSTISRFRYSQRGSQTHFGYKVHIGLDEGSGLIRQAVLTPAKVYESEVADQLLSGDENAVYADRAYESKHRRKRLRDQGINDRIMHRSHKHQRELPYWQKRRNELIEPIRRAVEKVFGTWKRSYGYRRVRYRGLERNTVEMLFKAMAYNLRRADRLTVSCA